MVPKDQHGLNIDPRIFIAFTTTVPPLPTFPCSARWVLFHCWCTKFIYFYPTLHFMMLPSAEKSMKKKLNCFRQAGRKQRNSCWPTTSVATFISLVTVVFNFELLCCLVESISFSAAQAQHIIFFIRLPCYSLRLELRYLKTKLLN